MAQGICGRTAAALAMIFLGLPPAFAMDRVTNDAEAGGGAGGVAATRPCPTRFDYLVLASFADTASLLSLSSYHSRTEVGLRTRPLTGFLRVDYEVESAVNCPSRAIDRQRS
jgi:hypothetical protein